MQLLLAVYQCDGGWSSGVGLAPKLRLEVRRGPYLDAVFGEGRGVMLCICV